MEKAFSVKIIYDGRCGKIKYKEKEGEFTFGWEYGESSMIIHALDTIGWNLYCEEKSGEWAKNRRDEILKNIAEDTLRQTSPQGRYEIHDGCIIVYFHEPFLISFLTKIFR